MGRQRGAPGFTLIELMVALVIIGVLVTMATLSLGEPNAQRAQRAGERLAALIELAREEALFDGQDMALSLWRHGYSFHRRENQQWLQVTREQSFRPRKLAEGLRFNLYLDGLEAELAPAPKKRPQVFVLTSGQVSPFQLSIGAGSDASPVVVTADPLGNVELVTNVQ